MVTLALSPIDTYNYAMQATYDELGVSFQYPDNWTLDDSEVESGQGEVIVYSPEGAFWSLTIHPRRTEPGKLTAEAVQVLKKEYPDCDAEPVTESIADQELSGFDVTFIYLDLMNTAVVRGVRTPRATYLILCQAEDREFERIKRVFEAITTSLLRPQGVEREEPARKLKRS